MTIMAAKDIPLHVCVKVLHSIVDRLLGVGLPAPNYSDYAEYWTTLPQWLQYTETCSDMLLRCACSADWRDQISARFGADSETAKALSEVVKCRQSDLRRAVANHSCKLQPHYLQDFDWELNLVLGSDKISTIDEPVVDIALDIRDGGASRGVYKQTQVTLGMNAEKLDDLISNLDNINKELLQHQL